jgi:hypothetical protein
MRFTAFRRQKNRSPAKGRGLPGVYRPRLECLEDRTLPSSAAVLANLPLSFEANVGQADAAVHYLAHGAGYALGLTDTGAVLDLHQGNARGQDALIRMELVGGNPTPQAVGLDQQAGHSNYLIGNDPSQWHTDVPLFGRVEYQQVYTGIDVVYYGNDQHQLEYNFVLAAGADASQIGLHFDGTQGLAVDNQGNLVLHLAGGDLVQQAPVIYQDAGGVRTPVAGGYVLHGDGTVAITLGGYDPTQAMVLDPVLVYSTYLGGSGNDDSKAIAVDVAGNAYVVGDTFSGFPTTLGAYQTTFGGAFDDAFVTKLNAAGNALVYSTYLGGSGEDLGDGIAIDGAGNAYVTGTTNGGFPTTPGAYQTTFGGDSDAFVTKLNAAGNALFYSTYLGGSGHDEVHGIAVDGAGNAYVTGSTSGGFPTTPSAYQTTFGGGVDAFVTKLNAAGTDLVYSTYLPSSLQDEGHGIAVDGAGNAYVVGDTFSGFPTTPGAYQTTFGGAFENAFVAKLNAAGNALVYSTYLRGSGDASGDGIGVDAADNAYVTGSGGPGFPTTPVAYQTSFGGGPYDAFVTKLNAAGTALVYSTYLGGSGADAGAGIAVDGAGNAYVMGSSAEGFPTTPGAYQTSFGGGMSDAFVTRLNAAGTALVYSTYLGGSGEDLDTGIAIDGAGNAYVSGYSTGGFPITPFAYHTTFNGGLENAFVAKLPDIGPLSYATPQDSAIHHLTLLRDGDNLELIDNGTIVRSRVYANTTRVSISAATLSSAPFLVPIPAFLTIDNASGGLIGLNISFVSLSPQSPLTITTTSAADTLTLVPGKATLDTTQVITFNVGSVTVNGSADDTASTGSAVTETFSATPTTANLSGPFGSYTMNGFGSVVADGGLASDTAILTVPAGEGTWTVVPSLTAIVSGPGFRNVAENFPTVQAHILVTRTNDSGPDSLRQAILDTNGIPLEDFIDFAISGSGVQTIAPSSPLPDVSYPVTINGYTQPESSRNTLAVGDNAVLRIQLDGSNAGLGANGLHITAGGSTVQGLDITRFTWTGAPTCQGGVAILLETKGGNVIQGNFLGTNASGSMAMGNIEGVNALQGAFGNTIGGTTPAARNLISGNIDGYFAATGATSAAQGNVIEGNYVGLNAAGTSDITNTEDGVVPGNYDTVGGTAPGAGNVISGHGRSGINLGGNNVVVQGNLIGTNAAGTAAVGNDWGILASNVAFDQIGGTTAAARNIISGNFTGIEIDGTYSYDNIVQGNYIGTAADGTAALGNVYDGVYLAFTSRNTIGGPAPGASNVISGNGLYGIEMANSPGFDGSNNLVEGNLIGTNAAGTGAVGNQSDGIHLSAGAHDDAIGDTIPGAGNTIAFNKGAGVAIVDATAINNSIRGNSIHDNKGLGIDLGNDGVTLNGPSPRTGRNHLENFPVIQVAGEVAGGTGVDASLDSLPNSPYGIDFFATTADPSGYGQGQTYLGSTGVVTDGSGHAVFTILLPAVAPGSVITATATDVFGNTSEFSADAPLQPLADLNINAFGALRYTAAPGLANNLTISLAGGNYTFHDSSERIFVTGAGSASYTGTGTNSATGPAGGIGSIFVTGSQTNLTVDDSLDNAPHNATVYAAGVSGLFPVPVSWLSSQISALTVSSGLGGNTFTIPGTGTFPTTLNSGAGNDVVILQATSGSLTINGVAGSDTITLGSKAPALGGTLANLLGNVQVGNLAGSTSLLVDDSGDGTGQSLGITNQAVYVFGLAHPLLTYTAGQVNALTILGGRGNDTFSVPYSLVGMTLTVDGGAGSNNLFVPNTTNTWQFTGPNQGSLDGSVTFQNMQTLIGGALADVFAFHTSGRLDGTLTDTGGVNTLDYSAYTGDIIVDLALGLATGVAGGAAGGVYHIANVIGSIGNDVLVGDANANVFVGGTGRNILIGGAGLDTITGGGGDNILIGGTTSYDTNLTALHAIMTEWLRTDLSFHQRMNDLTVGGGANGSYVLNADPNNGPVTVFDDAAPDVLTGGSGAGLDWFFSRNGSDTINNKKPGDHITRI